MTVDNKRKDKYELIKELIYRQDIAVSLLERSLGSNENVRTAFLEFLFENLEIKENEAKSRICLQKLNLVGGVKILPMLEIEEIKQLLEKIKGSIS